VLLNTIRPAIAELNMLEVALGDATRSFRKNAFRLSMARPHILSSISISGGARLVGPPLLSALLADQALGIISHHALRTGTIIS